MVAAGAGMGGRLRSMSHMPVVRVVCSLFVDGRRGDVRHCTSICSTVVGVSGVTLAAVSHRTSNLMGVARGIMEEDGRGAWAVALTILRVVGGAACVTPGRHHMNACSCMMGGVLSLLVLVLVGAMMT